ncbi:MAG: hypothetical protein JWQ95_1809 [Sphaerisporangium sp.]|nr:hypothetical protein [Sphaerisporangium sp.]
MRVDNPRTFGPSRTRGRVSARRMRLVGELALLALAARGVACMVSSRRMQRMIDGISDDLSKINSSAQLAKLSQAPSGGAAHLMQNLETTLDRFDGLRWFAADLSHELRTPFTALRAELEEAELHPDQTDVRQLVRCSMRNLDRTQAVITDMLLLARVQATREEDRERFDLGQLVKDEIDMRMDRVPIVVRTKQPVTIKAVREQIRQVVTNLLDNAVRHADQRVEVEICRTGEMAQFSVDDDGQGVPEADRESIFERFTRLKDRRRWDQGSVGLGLPIACAIAQAQCGGIQVEDAPLGGARFVFWQPAASPDQ